LLISAKERRKKAAVPMVGTAVYFVEAALASTVWR
jgi:hypothetical protein